MRKMSKDKELGAPEYEILEPEEEKETVDYADTIVKVMAEAQSDIDAKLAEFGISPDLDIEDDDALLVARSMLDGTLDKTLAYIRDKYISKQLPPPE